MNPLFKKIKKSVSVALVLMLALGTLSSCAEIDDSSVIEDASANSSEATVSFALQGETDCEIYMYNHDSSYAIRYAEINAELQTDLRELFKKEPWSTDELTIGPNYYMSVTFADKAGNKETYYVYSNDTVGYSSSVSSEMTLIAEIRDIYASVGAILNEAQKKKIEAEEKAGFAFEHLTFRAEGAYDYDQDTFSELGCMGIECIHIFEDGVKLWSANFKSQTEEEILAIAEALKAWEGVVYVGFEFISNPE